MNDQIEKCLRRIHTFYLPINAQALIILGPLLYPVIAYLSI
jgi:hypothetical protein